MGHAALPSWAKRKQARLESEYDARLDYLQREKRVYWQMSDLGFKVNS